MWCRISAAPVDQLWCRISVPQKFCTTLSTGAAEILHHFVSWCRRNSAPHQKFCNWCCRNSAPHYQLMVVPAPPVDQLVPQKFCTTLLVQNQLVVPADQLMPQKFCTPNGMQKFWFAEILQHRNSAPPLSAGAKWCAEILHHICRTGAAEILHHIINWCHRNSAPHYQLVRRNSAPLCQLVLQKFCTTLSTGAAEILHQIINWCHRNSAPHYQLVPQKFCTTLTAGAAEILHHIINWCHRNSAPL